MRWVIGLGLLLMASLPAAAQDEPNVEQLKGMYKDALVQLKAAQERRNDLANENQKLAAQIQELQRRLDEADRQLADHARQTFFLRSQAAAWEKFIDAYPRLKVRWQVFLSAPLLERPYDPRELVVEENRKAEGERRK